MQHTGVFTRQELDNYFASYVGMEGGNPRASLWICDRSPHPWYERLAGPLRPRTEPPAWDAAFRAKHREDMGKWLNHQRIARIMAAARAQALDIRLDDNDWKAYYRDELYAPDGAQFKLNLFPLPLMLDGLTPWSKVFRGQSELVPKERYLDLCRHGGRFRFLRSLCAHWRPKVVVCIGYRQADDFARAFELEEVTCEERQLQPADQVRLLQIYKRDGTTWIICPALAGSAGLTSDVQLNAFGKLLGASLAPSDFDHPCAAALGRGGLPESLSALLAESASRGLPGGGYPAQRHHQPDPRPARQHLSDCVPQAT
ncbi:structural elements [Cupriavidus basilensis]|uniref:Structural elements n=2 Tax=Cupriavidus basilensis TaxID=68895 RepID=A0A0C4YMI1_9BURK|nr:structural elements [Cupriavidus basilensis]